MNIEWNTNNPTEEGEYLVTFYDGFREVARWTKEKYNRSTNRTEETDGYWDVGERFVVAWTFLPVDYNLTVDKIKSYCDMLAECFDKYDEESVNMAKIKFADAIYGLIYPESIYSIDSHDKFIRYIRNLSLSKEY